MTALVRLAALLCLVTVGPAKAVEAGEQFGTYTGLALGKHTFADVQAKLGQAPVRHVGDAAESEYSICYSKKGKTVAFGSGELGGSDRELLSISMSTRPPHQRCAGWPATVPLSSTLGGLWLGMKTTQFVQKLGQQPSWNGTSATVVVESKHQVNGVTFDVVLTFEATFTADKRSSMTVSRTKTN